jgi:DNA polymerase I-like protein with 3'-5' exonuclease and polymerase domains
MDWQPLTKLPDLRRAGVIALDTETKDNRLRAEMGSGWPFRDGFVCGVSVAYHEGSAIRAMYLPLRHPDSANFDPAQVFQWLRDLVASDVRIVTQNGGYDFGWLHAEAGIRMPPAERLEEIGALATLVDENRHKYSLAALCEWRCLPGKDTAALEAGAAAIGLPKHAKPEAHIWQMPARYVGPYAEADAANTLALFESLDPVLDREGTRAAYRLEVDLLPMVLEMRRRGIRIDLETAERARDDLVQKRDAVFVELSKKLGTGVGMAEIGRNKWLAETFDKLKIKYPRTAKGNPSFTAGTTGWMHKHEHWLPRLITQADKYNKAAVNFLQGHILRHVVNGRIHAEIHPHRSDEGGTRSLRFSYSDPPLQQMAARDQEISPLIRGVFLPEEGELWAKPDISQQEFRFITHYGVKFKLQRAQEAAERYRADPNTDFHDLVAEMTGLDRGQAKNCNFAKAFGAGVRKFAAMVGKPEGEARAIYDRYDRELPFVKQLAKRCEHIAATRGYLALYDGTRRHWESWVPWTNWTESAGPCPREEAERRIGDPGHPWYGKGPLHRADTHKAMNALIQGSAARHTKLWMRACWREGFVPLLQMHDCLDLSVSSPEHAERVAQLGREAVTLEVPIEVDLKYGRTWGDATHTWEELHSGGRIDAPVRSKISLSNAKEPPAACQAERGGRGPEDHQDDPGRADTSGNQHDRDDVRERVGDDQHTNTDADNPTTEEEEPCDNEQDTGQQRENHGHGRDGYPHGERDNGHEVAFFVYRHADGRPYLGVKKTSTKQFPQFHWTGSGWAKGAPQGPKIPYRLPELIKAPLDAWVLICAGEKDADTAAALGFAATTNPEGERKGAWVPELNAWFAGRKRVAIMEDNDGTGRAHAIEVAEALRRVVPDIRIVTFRDLPEHGDLTDWKERGHGQEDLQAKIEATKPYRRRPQPSPIRQWDGEPIPELEYSVPDRYPLDNVGLLSGEGGQGKSSLVEQLCVAHVLERPWLNCTMRGC